MEDMFGSCRKLEELDVSGFDTSQVINMKRMFHGCENLKEIDVSRFDTSQVTDMEGMFDWCRNLKEIDVSRFDTSQVTDMKRMFYLCENLKRIDVSGFDTSQVTDMSEMFHGCKNLEEIDVSRFGTSQVTNMEGMFSWCTNLQELDVSRFDTSQVINMGKMFDNCEKLQELDVSGFDTSQVTNMEGMFSWCRNLEELDVSRFDTSQVTNMEGMFDWCTNLKEINMKNWNINNVEMYEKMFEYCEIDFVVLPNILSSETKLENELRAALSMGSWRDVTAGIDYKTKADIVFEAGHKYIHIEAYQVKEDAATGITIKKEDGRLFDSDIELNVSDVTTNEDYANYAVVANELGNINYLFDIALEKDGEAVQPDGTVLVSIPLPDGMSETAKVYSIAEDGTATDMNAVFADGYLTFATDHFSIYAVAGDKAVVGDVNGDGIFNMADAALVRRYVANLNVTIDTSAADVNKDGKIDMVDYALMRRALANWDVELK